MAGMQLNTERYTDEEYIKLARSVPNGFWWWGKKRYGQYHAQSKGFAKLRLLEMMLYTGTDNDIAALGRLLTNHMTTFDAELAEIDEERCKRRDKI